MKAKTILAIVGLILCAALAISYFVFFGDSFKNVYDQIRDRFDPAATDTESADDGEIPLDQRLFTHESDNFSTGYVSHNSGAFSVICVYFSSLEANKTYTLDWECVSDVYTKHDLKPCVLSDSTFGMLYSYNGSDWYTYGKTTSQDDFWKLHAEGRLEFTTDDNGMFIFSFWSVEEAPSYDTEEGQAVYQAVKESIHCYLF